MAEGSRSPQACLWRLYFVPDASFFLLPGYHEGSSFLCHLLLPCCSGSPWAWSDGVGGPWTEPLKLWVQNKLFLFKVVRVVYFGHSNEKLTKALVYLHGLGGESLIFKVLSFHIIWLTKEIIIHQNGNVICVLYVTCFYLWIPLYR